MRFKDRPRPGRAFRFYFSARLCSCRSGRLFCRPLRKRELPLPRFSFYFSYFITRK